MRNNNLDKTFENIIIIGNHNKYNEINNDIEIIEEYFKAKEKRCDFFKVWFEYLKDKLLILVCFDINKTESKLFKIIKLIIFIENYFFITILLFNDYFIAILINKVINNKQNEKSFNIAFKRTILIILICYLIKCLIFYFFDGTKKLKRIKNNNGQLDSKEILYLQKYFKFKLIIGIIIVFCFNFVIFCFSSVIGLSFPYSLKCFILSLIGYNLCSVLLLLFSTFLRWISLKFNYLIMEYIFDLSKFIAGLV